MTAGGNMDRAATALDPSLLDELLNILEPVALLSDPGAIERCTRTGLPFRTIASIVVHPPCRATSMSMPDVLNANPAAKVFLQAIKLAVDPKNLLSRALWNVPTAVACAA